MSQTIAIQEWTKSTFDTATLPRDVAGALSDRHGTQIRVSTTRRGSTLYARGWIGAVRLSEELTLRIDARTPIENLFGMFEVAFDLSRHHLLDQHTEASTIEQLFEHLAERLAQNVQERIQRGLRTAYVSHSERLPQLRGRLDLEKQLRRPRAVRLDCRYEEHTADTEDNQILAWTLRLIARSGLCGPRTAPRLRAALRSLRSHLPEIRPVAADACVGRSYDRLNEDYQPLHALCRFFLENLGPAHRVGRHEIQPFLVSMPYLFERFLLLWLEKNLPREYEIRGQQEQRVPLRGAGRSISLTIDMVLRERGGEVLAVLDAKYKVDGRIKTTDFNQAYTAAHLHGCRRAFLIYPVETPGAGQVGEVSVQGLCFDLQGDLETSGRRVLDEILRAVATR